MHLEVQTDDKGQSWVVVGGWRRPVKNVLHYDAEPYETIWMRTRGVHLMVESGWIISVLWGCSTYSSNYDASTDWDSFTETPTFVEVGILTKEGDDLVTNPPIRLAAHGLPSLVSWLSQVPSDRPDIVRKFKGWIHVSAPVP